MSASLKEQARRRLADNAAWNSQHGKKAKPACAHNRKAAARLAARVADWDRTVNDPANRTKVMTGYNKPGSMKSW